MATLSLRNIEKTYDGAAAPVIRGLDLDVADGEFMVFVGPSGCGKSTTLRMIAGLEEITGGELLIGGRVVNDLPPAKRGVAMVFQSYALYPHMTVAENMGFALKLAGASREEVATAVARAARILQIEPLLDRKPKALSGGQRQRVAIGRCIVRQPQVFLFDEPLSNLDAALRVQMRAELARLHRELRTTMVYVTHDQVEAMTLGHRIAVFNQGVIEQCGAPLDLYERPANRFVAGFIGSPGMNFLPVAMAAVAGELQLVLPGSSMWALPRERRPSAAVDVSLSLGVRPEHLELTSPGEGDFDAWVDAVEHLGGEQVVHLKTTSDSTSLIAKLDGDAPQVRAGEPAGVRIDARRFHLFSDDGRAVPLS